MYLKTVNSSQRPGAQYTGPFNLAAFTRREQRRTNRLVRAAYAVGHTHEWFIKLPGAEQGSKVSEWVEGALKARAIRLGQLAEEWSMCD